MFEIAKTGTTYASTPTILINFNGADGIGPAGCLIVDAAGNLFGTTMYGGVNDDGTVFEVAKNGASYASTPTTLVSFNSAEGGSYAGLIADAAGNLFGTTTGQLPSSPSVDGTVFEVTNTGFQVVAITGTASGQSTTDLTTIAPFSKATIADANASQTETVTVTLSEMANGTLSNLGGGSYNAITGVYTDTGSPAAVTTALDGLVFTPTPHEVAPGQSVTTSFAITDTDTAGASALFDSTTTVIAMVVDPGPTAGAVDVSVNVGQTVDLTSAFLAHVAPGLVGDTETITSIQNVPDLTLTNGHLIYSSPTNDQGIAPLTTFEYGFSYTVTDQLGNSTDGEALLSVVNPDPGPTAGTVTVCANLGQPVDLTPAILAQVNPGLPGDTETVTAVKDHQRRWRAEADQRRSDLHGARQYSSEWLGGG